jgi:hypothetical protein
MDLIRCTRCVKQVPPLSKFCRRCGCSIRSPRPTQTAISPKPAIPARNTPQNAPKAGGFVFAAFVAIAAPVFLVALLSHSTRHEPRIEYVPFMSGGSTVHYDHATPSSTVIQPSPVIVQPRHVIVPPQPYTHPFPPGFDQHGRWVGVDAAGQTMTRPGEPPVPHVSPFNQPAYGSRAANPNATNPGASPSNRR